MAAYKFQTTLRLDPAMHAKLKIIAESETRSVTNMIEHLIKQKVAVYEKEHGPIILTDEELYPE